MNKNIKRKGNLKYSLLLLLLLAVLLVSSTYAWFTANKVVSISTIDVNVQAQNGLQISADASNWKAILQKTDITGATATYATNKNQVPDILETISTAGNVTSGYLDMFAGSVSSHEGEYILKATKEAAEQAGTTGKYIAFDVFLKVDQDTDIVLTTDSSVEYKPETTDRGLQNAARVAFLVKGNVGPGSTSQNAQELDGGDTSSTYIWEPNYDVHTASAVQHAKDTYGITTTTTGGSQLSYDGIKADISGTDVKVGEANKTYHPDNFEKVTPKISTKQVFDENQTLFKLTAGVTKVRIYMWIEGQDVDCENNASGSDVSFNLQFSVAE